MNLYTDIKITPRIESLRLQDISDEEYFSAKYSNYISNSRLALINPKQNGTPDKFFNGSFNNFSDSLVLGSAVHELVLQSDSFTLCDDVNRPTGKMGYIADYLYNKENITDELLKEAALKYDYYGGNLTETKLNKIITDCSSYWSERKSFENGLTSDLIPIYLDSKSRDRLKSLLVNINSNKQFQNLLYPKGLIEDPISANEKTILLDVEVEVKGYKPFILKLKSKLDNYTIEDDTITVNDLKTTGKTLNYFDEAIETYHYYRELAMYSYLLRLCAQKFFHINKPKIKCNFLVASTIPNFYTKVVPLTKKQFIKGLKEFKFLLRLVAYYVATRYSNFASV